MKLIMGALVFASAGSVGAQVTNAGQDVVIGQEGSSTTGIAPSVAAVAARPVVATAGYVLPASTLIQVTPAAQIRSNRIEVGDVFQFNVVQDVVQDGYVVIPRGAIVQGTISFKTGRAIGGKSGKFDITWSNVRVGDQQYPLQGIHHQEGKGNTTGALLGSIFISGRSAQLDPGQVVTAMTAAPIPFTTGN